LPLRAATTAEILAAGAAGFIAKPFEPENLAFHLKEMVWWDRRNVLNYSRNRPQS
jgi:CheY-like chemotaxis protein